VCVYAEDSLGERKWCQVSRFQKWAVAVFAAALGLSGLALPVAANASQTSSNSVASTVHGDGGFGW